MLVTLKEILNLCEARKCAVGSFNTPNLESIMAVIGAAEELNVPVIIQHAEVHESIMPLSVIGPIMLEMAKKAKVPVAVHIDHGETVEYIYRALNMGFTSVMFDGSTQSFEENTANTQLVVSLAAKTGASVEAEIGCMGKRETGTGSAGNGNDPDKIYTDPDLAKEFVEKTGIDALACSFGTTHGVYISEPKLDFSVIEKVRAKTGIPDRNAWRIRSQQRRLPNSDPKRGKKSELLHLYGDRRRGNNCKPVPYGMYSCREKRKEL